MEGLRWFYSICNITSDVHFVTDAAFTLAIWPVATFCFTQMIIENKETSLLVLSLLNKNCIHLRE